MATHLSDDATRMRASSALPIARNTALLSASLAAHSAMIQLAAAVASITLIAWERGRLLGVNDLLSGATGAGLTLLGGFVLTAAGVTTLAIGAVVLLIAPALWILRDASSQATTTSRRRS